VDFLAISGCETHFKSELHRNTETDIERLHMQFSALNVDFDGPNLDFLGSKNLCTKASKTGITRKSCYFIAVSQSFMKTVADRQGHVTYCKKHW